MGSMVARDISPLALTAARFFLALIVIGALAAATGVLNRKMLIQPWRHLVLGGLFGMYFVLMFQGLKTASAVATSAIFTLTPLLAAGFGWLILRQIATPRVLMALCVGALGALWVIVRGDPALAIAFRVGEGEAIYFIGCILHALYIPLVLRLNRGESALAATFGMLVGGTLVLALAGGPAVLANGLEYTAAHGLDHAGVPDLGIGVRDLPVASVCQYAPDLGTGDGLYLPHPDLGHLVGTGAGKLRATADRVGGGIGLSIVALFLLLRVDPPSKIVSTPVAE